MFASLGHWNTAVYVVLALHFVPVWLVGSYHHFHHHHNQTIITIEITILVPGRHLSPCETALTVSSTPTGIFSDQLRCTCKMMFTIVF